MSVERAGSTAEGKPHCSAAACSNTDASLWLCSDQLWTNDGRFKPPEPGREYPPDLVVRIAPDSCFQHLTDVLSQGYPEPNAGWMNEEGVRIDMEHCLIPKPPLRSALKRPKAGAGNQ